MNDDTNTPQESPNEPANQTPLSPEDLAKSAFQKDTAEPDFASISEHKAPGGKKKKFSLKHLSKKQKILLCIGLALVLSIASFLVWYFVLKAEPTTEQAATQETVEAPAPTTEASRLTGIQVEPEVNKRHVTAVMIENSPDARPQSGLKDADIVYEAVAEAGITRFLALFQDSESKYIGPVRSARPYYLDWLLPFDPGYAHAGGSPDALKQIKQLKIKDLDQFHNPSAYERISSRYAPHNLYTSIPKLDKLEKQKDYTTSNVQSFARKATETPSDQVTAATINFSISSSLYNVAFKYDKKNNQYNRYMAGKKHVDEKSGKQIKSKVVIALVMKKGLMSDRHHTKYTTLGEGKMFVFQDGTVIEGTWKKTARDKQFTFTQADGSELQLNPGKTWITIVSATSGVSYKP